MTIRCQYVAAPFLTGLDVRAVQAVLTTKWQIDVGGVDGVYGPRTEDGVKVFQGRRGLSKTGNVDVKTFDHMTRG